MLKKQGLSYDRIIEAVRERYGVCLRKSNISYWTRGIHSPYNGIHIPSAEFLKPSRELAYVIGVVAGDGYVRRRPRARKSYDEVYIGLKVKDREFAEEFSRCLATVLKRKPPKLGWSRGLFVVELQCKVLYELLRKPLDIERLRRFVEYSAECKSAFLRGFFDSEGSVGKTGEILVYNTDLGLLKFVKLLLSSLGVETSGPRLKNKRGTPFIDPRGKTYYTKKDIYYLYVPPDHRLNFYQHIGLTIKRKQQRLEDFLIRTGRLKPPAKPPLFFPNNTILI